MLPSNSSISYADQQAIFHRPFLTDISHNSRPEDPPPLSLFHFPSPFIQYDQEEDVFLQHHLQLQQQPLTADCTVAETLVNMFDSNKNDISELMGGCKKKIQQTPRKRSSKRDRHSKINTAQGPRDRRMRLSLEIARKFFDLQDMLGFDKASKTVEWLLSKSKTAIKELAKSLPQMKGSYSVGTKSASSTSECEVVSGFDETVTNGGIISKTNNKPSTCASKEKKMRQSRKAAFHTLARESREKARARARERTKEKLWNRNNAHESNLFADAATNQDLNQVGSNWSPFGTGEESASQSHNMNPPLVEEPTSHEGEHMGIAREMVDDSSIFNYLHNMGIFQEVSSNKKFPDLSNIDSARKYYSSYCALTSMHNLSMGANVQDGIPNSSFLTTPYDCLQHQFADFQF